MNISESLREQIKGPKRELDARLSEVETAASFLMTALRLRPRLGRTVRWDTIDQRDQSLAQRFLAFRDVNRDPLIASLLVICYGALEGYVCEMIERTVRTVNAVCESVDDIPKSLLMENVFRTGRAYLTAKRQRGHIEFDFPDLARTLAKCRPGNPEFVLNAECFRYEVGVVSPSNLSRALARLGVDLEWDSFGRDEHIREVLGFTGTRQCAKAMEKEVEDLVIDRNSIAHTGQTRTSRDFDDVRRYARVLPRFCLVLTEQVARQVDARLRRDSQAA